MQQGATGWNQTRGHEPLCMGRPLYQLAKGQGAPKYAYFYLNAQNFLNKLGREKQTLGML